MLPQNLVAFVEIAFENGLGFVEFTSHPLILRTLSRKQKDHFGRKGGCPTDDSCRIFTVEPLVQSITGFSRIGGNERQPFIKVNASGIGGVSNVSQRGI